MPHHHHERPRLIDETCRKFAALALLDQVIAGDRNWHVSLIEQQDDYLLEPVFKYLLEQDLVQIGEDDLYHATNKGVSAYHKMLLQQQSYLIHYDVFAAVDLAEGAFGDPESDAMDDPRWSDLRVAVGEYKGIDPYRLVFLSMLADGTFFEESGWKFDIALGSSFFKELEEIVQSQISVEDLEYEAEDGSSIPGDAVIEDVILQGTKLNQERLEEEEEQQPSFFDDEPGNGNGTGDENNENNGDFAPYNPWPPMEAYLTNPQYVEAIWLGDYW